MLIWVTIVGMAAVTLATRALPLVLLRGDPPGWLRRWLALVPAAVFMALALPPLLLGPGPALPGLPTLAAGLAGALAAWRGAGVPLTIAAGLAAYWLVRLLGA